MKVLITGGHFSPAYSLIGELKKRGNEIIIAGRRYPFEDDKSESLEYLVSKEQALKFYEVKTGRFQRKFTAYTIASLFRTPIGILTAFKILLKSKPDVVLTFGGYIGLPIALAAKLLNIKIVLHEQTQRAGLASRIISKFADKVCISFEKSIDFFPKERTVLTGNPVRDEIFEPKKKILIPVGVGQAKVIYVTGGSTGSHFINSIMYEVLPDLLSDFVVIHQTGDSIRFRDFEKLDHLRKTLPIDLQKRYILRKFIYPDEIGDVLLEADLVISRAGANIVFELMAMRKMSLLIPLPHGQNLEQLENAKLLKDLGISEYKQQNDAAPRTILDLIHDMFKNRDKYQSNMKNVREFVRKDAAREIASVVEKVYGEKNS